MRESVCSVFFLETLEKDKGPFSQTFSIGACSKKKCVKGVNEPRNWTLIQRGPAGKFMLTVFPYPYPEVDREEEKWGEESIIFYAGRDQAQYSKENTAQAMFLN